MDSGASPPDSRHVTAAAPYVFAVLALCLLGVGAYGQVQKARAARAEAALAEAREDVARFESGLESCQASTGALRERVAQQNAATDELAEAGQFQARRLAAADAEARVLRELARSRAELVLSGPAPVSCGAAVALLRDAAPDLSW